MADRFGVKWVLLLICSAPVAAQQLGDERFEITVQRPAYPRGQGPLVLIDEAHQNFHTVKGRYRAFAELLRADGYRVGGLSDTLSETSLREVGLLVIANALHERNVGDWSLPTPSAFSRDEITSLRAWVEQGGSLFLIADHMPFPGAVSELAQAFGVRFSNGFATPGRHEEGIPDRFDLGTGLQESVATRGRNTRERVTEVVTFTGSAFMPPEQATPVLVFGPGSTSREPRRAWVFNESTPTVSIEGWCQIALLQVGRGRVLVSGEAAMFTAQVSGPDRRPMGMNNPYAKQNAQLLLNLMHWLSRLPEITPREG